MIPQKMMDWIKQYPIMSDEKTQSTLDYIVRFHRHLSIVDNFIKSLKRKDSILNKYLAEGYIKYEKLKENFPILGNLTPYHSFFAPPLYRYINPTEPQFTGALCDFMQTNQQCCQAFVQAILELHREDKKDIPDIPEKGFSCFKEVKTLPKDEHKRNHKFIDDLFKWNNHVLCIEIKFDAKLYNELSEYEKYVKDTYPSEQRNFVVISMERLSLTDKQQQNWRNLLWYDVLKKWESNISKKREGNFSEETDLVRYRSSLWHKVLN